MTSNKKNQRIYIILALLLLILSAGVVVYLQYKEPPSIGIAPPVPEADIPFDAYTLHSDSQLVIERSTGTRLVISPGSLARKDGKAVEGPIVVKVREFHTASDIVRAGIPMRAQGGYLESAGMLEVRAYNNDAEMELRDNQYIDVSLAAYRPSEGYDLYSLQQDKDWIVKDSFLRMKNDGKRIRLQQLDSIASIKPVADTADDFYFELAFDTSEAPHLIPFIGQQWQLIDRARTDEVKKSLRILWDDVQIKVINKRQLVYQLTFSSSRYKEYGDGPEKTFRVEVTPVVKGKHKRDRREQFDKQMEGYAQGLQKLEDEKKRVQQQADLVNSFQMRQLGISNIDRLYKMGEYVRRKVSFDFEKTNNSSFNNIQLFVLFDSSNFYMSYAHNDWDKVLIPRSGKMTWMVVLSKDEIAVIDMSRFQSEIQQSNEVLYLNTKRVNATAYLKSLGSVTSVP